MSRRSQPPPDLQQQQGVGQVEEEVIEGVGEGDEIMEDAQVGEGDYSMSVSKPPPSALLSLCIYWTRSYMRDTLSFN